MKLAATILFLIIALYTGKAQGRFDDVKIITHQVTDQVYMLEGAGGNIGILKGEEGILMIDDQFADLSPKIKNAIKEIGSYPVSYLVNTHWHGDHTGGNTNFSQDGTTIIAHDNVKEKLSNDQVRPFGRTTPASPETAWPKLTFDNKMKIHFNDETIHLIHVHSAHTDGDAFVYFEKNNILHMGDCFFKDRFPFIDIDLGGSAEGYLQAVSYAIMLCNSETKIIPGHGSLATKDDLMNFYSMLIHITDKVKKTLIENKTLEEALEANLTDGYEDWGSGFINHESIIKTLYKSFESIKD